MTPREAAASFPEFPFQGHRLNVRGLSLHYLDEGPTDAPPILMLHGNPTWSFYYRRLISALRPNHRVIVPDHIGMGLSDKPDETQYDFTLESRVDDLEELIDSLYPPIENRKWGGAKIENRLTLVLHDWGGMIGMAYATRHPDRIARLVILNTGGFSLPKSKRLPWQLTLARSPILGSLLVRGFNAFSRGAVKDCVTRRPLPLAVARAYLAPYNSWHSRLAVHRFIQDIPLRPGDRAFELVAHVEQNITQFQKLPMLICWGMKDFVFDVHFLNRWQELFPAAEVHRFAYAGHYVLEDAHEEIIPLVQSFLSAHPVPPTSTVPSEVSTKA